MYMLNLFTWFSMIERSDFTGLILGVGTWYLFVQKSIFSIKDQMNKLVYVLLSASVYDIIWLIIHFSVSKLLFNLSIK